MEVSNDTRADWAQLALDEFIDECGTSGEAYYDISDLICDLLHLAKRSGCDPLDVASKGIGTFSAEDRSGGDPYGNDNAHITIEFDERTTECIAEQAQESA
jgi:hypothetical protein